MASSTQHEQVHHRKEDDDVLHQEDLNKEAKADDEAKHEDDDDKIVEQEVKDADQEDESRGPTMVVPSSPRILPQEEEAKPREDEAGYAEILLSISDHDEEDDSEQTMTFLTRWKAPETPPEKIIPRTLVEQCSRPIQKQLTTSDVKQRKLCLSRKKFQPLLDESEARHGVKETRFRVYGPDGKVHEIWLGGKKKSFDLTTGWWTFLEEYGLKECCDFVTVWMFRHTVTQLLCLAIDTKRFAFRKQVSKRISDAAFEDSD